jgi:hypothetical protein
MRTVTKLGALVLGGLLIAACGEQPSDVTPGDPGHTTPYPGALDAEPPQEQDPEPEEEPLSDPTPG